jgi:hypothetical protein
MELSIGPQWKEPAQHPYVARSGCCCSDLLFERMKTSSFRLVTVDPAEWDWFSDSVTTTRMTFGPGQSLNRRRCPGLHFATGLPDPDPSGRRLSIKPLPIARSQSRGHMRDTFRKYRCRCDGPRPEPEQASATTRRLLETTATCLAAPTGAHASFHAAGT